MRTKLIFAFIAMCFTSTAQEDKTRVTETTVKVGALSTEEIFFGFAENDEIIVNIDVVKGKDLKEVEVFEYPNSSIFMDYKTSKIKDKKISITKQGVYKFSFKNSSMGVRILKLRIERIPYSEETADFNTTVYWKTVSDTTFYTEQEKYLINKKYESKTIIPTTEYYINSGSNAMFKGGKSRITFPVNIPENTVEWYYQFSATRSKEEINNTKSSFDLANQLTSLIDQTGALSFGIDALTQPPGADYCDIYLLNHENSSLFLAKTEYTYFTSGSRENIKSGIVKIPGGAKQNFYIGIKNPDSTHGIHVGIEVVAILLIEEWGVRDVQKYNILTSKVPYLK